MSPGSNRGEKLELAWFNTTITILKLNTVKENTPPIRADIRVLAVSTSDISKYDIFSLKSAAMSFFSTLSMTNVSIVKQVQMMIGKKAMLLTTLL
jgi:hypothetical protein